MHAIYIEEERGGMDGNESEMYFFSSFYLILPAREKTCFTQSLRYRGGKKREKKKEEGKKGKQESTRGRDENRETRFRVFRRGYVRRETGAWLLEVFVFSFRFASLCSSCVFCCLFALVRSR